MLDVGCPGCRRVLKVKDELAGRKGKCPHCGHALTIPAPSAVAPSANPADAATVAPEAAAAVEDLRGETQSGSDATGGPTLPSPLIDFLAPPQGPGEIGRLGPYRVLKVLGAGGMGVVYRAEDPHLQRPVALKVMLPSLAASASARERFLREARHAASVEHDNVVAIYQVGEDRGVPFLAMPLLRGESLDDRLKRGRRGEVTSPLPLSEALRIARETATGLEAARKRGLIHRDIKPANLWLEEETGRVKILDFGLARAAAGDSQLTQEGAILGTPAYMAPEQANGAADHRADLFSLGCVLYRMATGEAPFKGTDTISTLMAVAMEEPRRPREINPALPAALSDLIMRLLSKKPESRPASAQAVVEAIRAIEADPTQVVLRPRPAVKPAPKAAVVKPAAQPPAGKSAAAIAPTPPARKKANAAVWISLGAAVVLAAAALVTAAGYGWWRPNPLPAAAGTPGPDDGPSKPVVGEEQRLFNGQNLNGWTVLKGNKYDNWDVEDGVLYTTGAKRNWLLTDQEYGDFVLRLEYRIAEGTNSGVGLRAAGERSPNVDGLEMQIIDDGAYPNLKPNELNGALFGLAPPAGAGAGPANEWNRVEITLQGRQLTEKINDRIVLQANLNAFKDKADKFPGVLYARGRIGLQSHTGRAEFRDLYVRPLAAENEPAGFGGRGGGGVKP